MLPATLPPALQLRPPGSGARRHLRSVPGPGGGPAAARPGPVLQPGPAGAGASGLSAQHHSVPVLALAGHLPASSPRQHSTSPPPPGPAKNCHTCAQVWRPQLADLVNDSIVLDWQLSNNTFTQGEETRCLLSQKLQLEMLIPAGTARPSLSQSWSRSCSGRWSCLHHCVSAA